MPITYVKTADEWEKLTGSRGSVYIGFAPARRPAPSQQTPKPDADKKPE